MHHGITYMYINFQQNRVCRSVKTVRTNYLHNIYRKMHKLATTNSNFFLNLLLQTCVFVKRTCRPLYSFSAKFATANSNFERINLFGHASP